MAAINFPPRTQGVPDPTLVTLGDLSTQYYWTGEQWLSVGLGGLNGDFLPLSGGTITGPTQVNDDLTVFGNISASNLIYSQGGVVKPLSGVGGIVVNNNLTNVTVISATQAAVVGSLLAAFVGSRLFN